jgi:GntP family gluconate:H+ symporter
LFAVALNRVWQIPMRASPDVSLEQLHELAKRPESDLPPLVLSLAPILLPVALIGGQAIFETDSSASPTWAAVSDWLQTLGDKNIALTLAAMIAMGTWIWKRRPTLHQVAESTQAAIASAGVIILITAAGGAFGAMLKQTGVADLLEAIPKTSTALMLTLAFLVTTAVRTAQGSATVAMITAVGILAPLAASGELGCHPVYLAMAIGCGSKPIAWMNDSGFWVICKMSGLTEAEGLRSVTPMSLIMGVSGLVATLIAALAWPLTP